MPAALFMSSLMIWIRAKAEKEMDVSQLVKAINNEISSDTSTMFATLFIAIIHTKSGVMQYCDAGHCPVLVVENGKVKQLEVDKGLPIGVMPYMPYKAKEVQLSSQATLVMYTDGITEAENKELHMYGSDRLEKFIGSLREQIEATAIIDNVQQFAGDYPQSDDIAVLVCSFVEKT